jgi:DNA-binding response OmpR family regulator
MTRVPIIVLSGRVASHDKVDALEAGADDYVTTWGRPQDLRQYLAQLRRKLEADPGRPRHLITEPGMGYRFRP